MGIGHEVDTEIGPSRIQPCTAAAPTHAESARSPADKRGVSAIAGQQTN